MLVTLKEAQTGQAEWSRLNKQQVRGMFFTTKGMITRCGDLTDIIIINDTLARSLEPVVTECKEHTIHTQTQIVASRKPKEIKHTHEGEANFT